MEPCPVDVDWESLGWLYREVFPPLKGCKHRRERGGAALLPRVVQAGPTAERRSARLLYCVAVSAAADGLVLLRSAPDKQPKQGISRL